MIQIFSAFLFILGFILIYLSFAIDNDIKNSCDKSDSVRKANKGLLVIGVILVTLASSYLFCQLNCNCTGNDLSNEIYAVVVLILSIILISLSSVIISGNCNSSKTSSNLVLTLSIFLLLSSIAYFAHNFKQKNNIQLNQIFKKM